MLTRMKLLIPETIEYFDYRYSILKFVSLKGPIGRRAISKELGISERTVRNELNVLVDFKYLETTSRGMIITNLGNHVLEELKELDEELHLNNDINDKISCKLGINKCIISDMPLSSEFGRFEVGEICSDELLEHLSDGDVLGVTGGRTVRIFAEALNSEKKYPGVSVIAARGAVGNILEYQADSIAYMVAKKLGAEYLSINIPDTLDDDFLHTLRYDPEINNALNYLSEMNILVMSVGRADTMGSKRRIRELESKYLLEKKAVLESFGSYYDIEGKRVFESDSILNIEDFKRIPTVILIAGGEEKAEAVISFSKVRKDVTLVMDKACALKILELVKSH